MLRRPAAALAELMHNLNALAKLMDIQLFAR
jgi:hypothetical protein